MSNSLKAHIEQTRQFLSDNPSLDYFGVAETRLDERTMDSIIRIDGYTIIRQDRNAQGGGVLFT